MDLNFSFDHLRIDEATAVFGLPWISPKAHLIVRPAIEANQPYFDALMRINGSSVRRTANKAVNGQADRESVEFDRKERQQSRDDDRNTLLPGNVVVGWEGIVNRNGEVVPFSVDACASFLRALPDWIIDRLRAFVLNPTSFVREAPPLPSIEELAGN